MSANFNSMLISREEYESFHQSDVDYIDDYPNQQFMSKDKETIDAKLCVFKPEDDIQTIFVAVYPPTNSTPDNQNDNATCRFIKRHIDKFVFVDIYPWAPITASGKIDIELLTKKIKNSKKRKMLSKAFWLYIKSIISYVSGNGITPMIVLCGPFIKTIFKDFKGKVEFVSTYTCDHETSKYRITGTDIEFNVKSTDHPSAHLLSNTNKQFPEIDLPMIKAFNERENDIDDISIKLEVYKKISIANKRIFMKSLKCKELKDEWSHWNSVNYTDDVMVRIANIRKTVGDTVFKSMMKRCFIDKDGFDEFCKVWHDKLGDKFVTFMSGSVAAAYDNTNFNIRINDLYNTLFIEHFLRLEGSFKSYLKSEDDSFVVSFKALYKKQNVKERANMMKVISKVCSKKNVKNVRFWKILKDCSKLDLTRIQMIKKIRDELKS